MSDIYDDGFKMRSFTKEEQEEWNNHIKSLSTIVIVSKEKYDKLKEAFLNLMSDSKCYCNNLEIHHTQCYYCEYKDLRKKLLNEEGDPLG